MYITETEEHLYLGSEGELLIMIALYFPEKVDPRSPGPLASDC
jgi:hypothetical protein